LNKGSNNILVIKNYCEKNEKNRQEIESLIEDWENGYTDTRGGQLLLNALCQEHQCDPYELREKLLPKYLRDYIDNRDKLQKENDKFVKQSKKELAFFESPEGKKKIKNDSEFRILNEVILPHIKEVKAYADARMQRAISSYPGHVDWWYNRHVKEEVTRRYGHCPKWIFPKTASAKTLRRSVGKYTDEIDSANWRVHLNACITKFEYNSDDFDVGSTPTKYWYYNNVDPSDLHYKRISPEESHKRELERVAIEDFFNENKGKFERLLGEELSKKSDKNTKSSNNKEQETQN
jgi:hypothetical protein